MIFIKHSIYIMANVTFADAYENNTSSYKKMTQEERRVIELHGKMEHSLREYQRETYVYSILNIITVVAAIGAYRYLSTK